MKTIKLYKYFFEISNFDISNERVGNTKRSRKGKVFTDYSSNPYNTFNINITDINSIKHGNLLYIVNLCLPLDSSEIEPIDIDFIDPYGNQYTVTIPVNGYNFTPIEGEDEYYDWQLTLEEVI